MIKIFFIVMFIVLSGCGEKKKDDFREVWSAKNVNVNVFNDGLIHFWRDGDCIPFAAVRGGILVMERDGSCPEGWGEE